MAVPKDDTVCRFIRQKDWSSVENRPKPGAFKDPELSVWDRDKLLDHGVELEDLCIETLAGRGQAHYLVADFFEVAEEAAKSHLSEFEVRVEWRPEETYVKPAWRKWNYAHIQVEVNRDAKEIWTSFRRTLSLRSRVRVAPDGE